LTQIVLVLWGSACTILVLTIPPFLGFIALLEAIIAIILHRSKLTYRHRWLGKWSPKDVSILGITAVTSVAVTFAFPPLMAPVQMLLFLNVFALQIYRPFKFPPVILVIMGSVCYLALCFTIPFGVSFPLSLSLLIAYAFVTYQNSKHVAIVTAVLVVVLDVAWLAYLYVPRQAIAFAVTGIQMLLVTLLQNEGAGGIRRSVLMMIILTLTVASFSYLTFSFSVFVVTTFTCVVLSLIITSPLAANENELEGDGGDNDGGDEDDEDAPPPYVPNYNAIIGELWELVKSFVPIWMDRDRAN